MAVAILCFTRWKAWLEIFRPLLQKSLVSWLGWYKLHFVSVCISESLFWNCLFWKRHMYQPSYFNKLWVSSRFGWSWIWNNMRNNLSLVIVLWLSGLLPWQYANCKCCCTCNIVLHKFTNILQKLPIVVKFRINFDMKSEIYICIRLNLTEIKLIHCSKNLK